MLDVARLASLADQLLDLERLDSDGARLQWLDLGKLVADAVADIAALAVVTSAKIWPSRGRTSRSGSWPTLRRSCGWSPTLCFTCLPRGGPGVAICVGVDSACRNSRARQWAGNCGGRPLATFRAVFPSRRFGWIRSWPASRSGNRLAPRRRDSRDRWTGQWREVRGSFAAGPGRFREAS